MKYMGPGTAQTVKSDYYYDDGEDKLVLHTHGDVQGVIDANKAAQNAWDGRFNPKKTFHHVASIPPEIALKWLHEEGYNIYQREGFEAIIKKKLNDPEWRYLKTKDIII